jgi:hypothetical protein
LSYRSRERKRRAKAAIAKTKRESSSVISVRYYRTIVKHACRCSACGGRLRIGGEMVYRHNGPVTLCIGCADKDPLVNYRLSLRWERAQRARRGKSA